MRISPTFGLGMLAWLMVCAVAWAAVSAPDQAASSENELGFVSLFNGKNLDGWEGDTQRWTARSSRPSAAMRSMPRRGSITAL